jgi:hypothetical protein
MKINLIGFVFGALVFLYFTNLNLLGSVIGGLVIGSIMSGSD